MLILFLHGWTSTPGGVKPTYLTNHGHQVLNPALPDDDFDAAVRIAQAEFNQGKPDVVVGSSRGGAVAMHIQAGNVPLVLLCPAWKRWGTATRVKPGTVILHSPADDVVPFSDSQELLRNSGLPESALIVVGTDHRLADPEPLKKMLEAVERSGTETMSLLPSYTLPHDRMPEAEVALRLAFYLLALPGASHAVTVCLDDQHVASGEGAVFPLTSFLAAENWQLVEQRGKRPWHGIYHRSGQELILSPNSRGGDVIMQLSRRRIRAECKKGPLEKRTGNPENQLLHDAIGQLMTIEEADASDLLVIAVPATEQFRKRLAWQERPLMAKTGIRFVLVGRDRTVEGLEDLLPGEDA